MKERRRQPMALHIIESNLEINTTHTYEIKRIDSDYFSEEE
jgi:restriction endonuclease Mrr